MDNVFSIGLRRAAPQPETISGAKGPSAREFIRLSQLLHSFCADGIASASPEWVEQQLSEALDMIRAGQFPTK